MNNTTVLFRAIARFWPFTQKSATGTVHGPPPTPDDGLTAPRNFEEAVAYAAWHLKQNLVKCPAHSSDGTRSEMMQAHRLLLCWLRNEPVSNAVPSVVRGDEWSL